MTSRASALISTYVIDGVQQEFTPAQLLGEVRAPESAQMQIVDETLDPSAKAFDFEVGSVDGYLADISVAKRAFPLAFPESYSRMKLAESLLDALWKKGSFRVGDLVPDVYWRWNEKKVGAMSAFYSSVQAVADYADALGLNLGSYGYSTSRGVCSLNFGVHVRDSHEESIDDFSASDPFRTSNPVMSGRRAVPGTLVPDAQSWLIYVPFDPCDFRLGGSLLAQAEDFSGASPQIGDADYFMDCYEVVREFVEDGILLSAATVGEGGLLKAVKGMTSGGTGAVVDIADIKNAYQEKSRVRVLFAEVPGVILQIRDTDFDYLDAELLLQDVAFFPLGHPTPGNGELRVKASAKSGIQTILESLMLNAEGED